MKLIGLFCLLILATACSSEPVKEIKKKEIVENLIEYKSGVYTEFYPGKKKVKIRGAQDSKKIRNGKWVLLSETGKEMSVTFFDKGKREGYSIVKYPTGVINYYGEYLHDEQIGVWKFHDEKGKLIRKEDHSKNPVEIINY